MSDMSQHELTCPIWTQSMVSFHWALEIRFQPPNSQSHSD